MVLTHPDKGKREEETFMLNVDGWVMVFEMGIYLYKIIQ